MGIWIDTVEARARLIHQEITSAQVPARSQGLDPLVFTGGPYDELARLYATTTPTPSWPTMPI